MVLTWQVQEGEQHSLERMQSGQVQPGLRLDEAVKDAYQKTLDDRREYRGSPWRKWLATGPGLI